jgi:hypothetical protein
LQLGSRSKRSLYRSMNALEASRAEAHAALEAELTGVLATYLAEHHSLNSWDCHRLGAAIAYLELGFYSQALERVTQILRPPVPLPSFSFPRALTLEDLRNAIRLASPTN